MKVVAFRSVHAFIGVLGLNFKLLASEGKRKGLRIVRAQFPAAPRFLLLTQLVLIVIDTKCSTERIASITLDSKLESEERFHASNVTSVTLSAILRITATFRKAQMTKSQPCSPVKMRARYPDFFSTFIPLNTK
ncbi:unnamed protein product [Larinioides sclopetarius]|uniref:Uncharacterized protein n=1 Tax=Larinioides sclopetarius TaxID=280406 RepID=A0AAV2A4B8_9ARAC